MTIGVKDDSASIVDVWQFDLDREARGLGEAEQFVSTYEHQRSLRSSAPSRQRRILARAALRTVLGSYTGRVPQALQFSYNAHGKPQLIGPNGPAEVAFNLATSHSCCLIAVTRGAQIGVDVESLAPLPAIDRIAAGMLSADEAAAIGRLTGEAKLTEFYACWTRLEARIKARGLGLTSTRTLPPIHSADDWTHLTLHPRPGFIGALSVKTGEGGIKLDVREHGLAWRNWA
jgi:4'-phosphopantetheinyl transferase